MKDHHRPVALPPYRSPDQFHGPCYVLDADIWNRLGWREVVAVLPASLPPQKRAVTTLYRPPYVPGQPLWHDRARALRARGMSIRRIMVELGLVNYKAVLKAVTGWQESGPKHKTRHDASNSETSN